jgi:hypothetical protein
VANAKVEPKSAAGMSELTAKSKSATADKAKRAKRMLGTPALF